MTLKEDIFDLLKADIITHYEPMYYRLNMQIEIIFKKIIDKINEKKLFADEYKPNSIKVKEAIKNKEMNESYYKGFYDGFIEALTELERELEQKEVNKI